MRFDTAGDFRSHTCIDPPCADSGSGTNSNLYEEVLSMKLLTSALFAFALLFAGASQASAANYKVDEAHAFSVFKIMHLGIAPAYGMFVKVGGDLTFDAADLAKAKVTINIDPNSVFTGNKKRDDHLKGPDFFDVKQFPKMSFESTAWKKVGDDFEVSGNMTLHGQTKPMTITVKKTGEGKDPWGNDRVGMEANFKLDRTQFGIVWGADNGALSKEVDLMIAIEFIKQK